MSHACVCGGSNENCRFCCGRGEISDHLANALSAHTYLPESKKVHLADKKSEGQPIEFSPTRLQKVQALIEKLSKTLMTATKHVIRSPAARPVGPSPSQLTGCPRGCGAMLQDAEALRRHLRIAHPFHPVGTRPWVHYRTSDSGPEYRICALCKARVRASNMNRHLGKAHGARPVRLTDRPAVSQAKEKRRSSSLIASRERNLDATKLYAHNYREHGRFGSHPSHDGFDDESGPD